MERVERGGIDVRRRNVYICIEVYGVMFALFMV